jgi:hypothetical protein
MFDLNRFANRVFVSRLVDAIVAKAAKPDGCEWRTIRGTPVCIDGDGTISQGPKSMVGKRPDQLPKNLPPGAGKKQSGTGPENSGSPHKNSGSAPKTPVSGKQETKPPQSGKRNVPELADQSAAERDQQRRWGQKRDPQSTAPKVREGDVQQMPARDVSVRVGKPEPAFSKPSKPAASSAVPETTRYRDRLPPEDFDIYAAATAETQNDRILSAVPVEHRIMEYARARDAFDASAANPTETEIHRRYMAEIERRLIMEGDGSIEKAQAIPKLTPDQIRQADKHITAARAEIQRRDDEHAEYMRRREEERAAEKIVRQQKEALNVTVEGLPDDWSFSKYRGTLTAPDGTPVNIDTELPPEEQHEQIREALKARGVDLDLVKIRGEYNTMGAEWLDDREPDEDGLLMRPMESTGNIIGGEGMAPEQWSDIPEHIQEDIKDSIMNALRHDIENDSDFYDMARESATEENESYVSDLDIANEIHSELTNADGEEMSPDEALEAFENGDDEAVEAFAEHRRQQIDEMLEGDWMASRAEAEFDSRVEMMDDDEEEWFRSADYMGLLPDEVRGSNVSDELMEELGIELDDIPRLIGAPEDFELEVSSADSREITVRFDDGNGVEMVRTIGIDGDGRKYVSNDSLSLTGAPPGTGAHIFSSQVAAMRKAGFEYIRTHAAGDYQNKDSDDGSYVGYGVWAQFGYGWKLPRDRSEGNLGAKVAKDWPDAENFQDIIESPGGVKWWWENGAGNSNAIFDLSDGSRSMNILNNYLTKKQSQRAAKLKAVQAAESGGKA